MKDIRNDQGVRNWWRADESFGKSMRWHIASLCPCAKGSNGCCAGDDCPCSYKSTKGWTVEGKGCGWIHHMLGDTVKKICDEYEDGLHDDSEYLKYLDVK